MNWGDSFSAGARCGSWPQHYGIVLARRLMAAFPCSAGNPTGGYYVPGYQSSVNGPSVPVTNTGSVSNAGAFGPGFVNLSFSATNTTTFTVTGTSVNIWCVKATSTRTFNVSIDGGADQLVTVPSAGSTTDGYLANFSLGAAGSHTVAIKYIATPVNIGGLDVFNGDETKGVHPIPAGHSGYGANDFITQDGVGGASLTNVAAGAAPHLITLMLGANDWGKGVESSAQFQTNLTTMITKFKAGAPNAAVLLVAPFPTQQQSTPLVRELRGRHEGNRPGRQHDRLHRPRQDDALDAGEQHVRPLLRDGQPAPARPGPQHDRRPDLPGDHPAGRGLSVMSSATGCGRCTALTSRCSSPRRRTRSTGVAARGGATAGGRPATAGAASGHGRTPGTRRSWPVTLPAT
jgi:lysophospholipase L1-like esterase